MIEDCALASVFERSQSSAFEHFWNDESGLLYDRRARDDRFCRRVLVVYTSAGEPLKGVSFVLSTFVVNQSTLFQIDLWLTKEWLGWLGIGPFCLWRSFTVCVHKRPRVSALLHLGYWQRLPYFGSIHLMIRVVTYEYIIRHNQTPARRPPLYLEECSFCRLQRM